MRAFDIYIEKGTPRTPSMLFKQVSQAILTASSLLIEETPLPHLALPEVVGGKLLM